MALFAGHAAAPPSAPPGAARRWFRAPLRSHDRFTAALALLVTAATHIPLIRAHLQEAPYVGWLFILLSVTSVLLAVTVAVFDSPAVWLLTALTTALALLAFFISRTIGLPRIGDDIGNWTEPLGFPAIIAEAIAAAVSIAVLRQARRARS